MDNKTMIKVINGMADKIDEFDNIIVEQYNLLYNKIEALDDKINMQYLKDRDSLQNLSCRIDNIEDKIDRLKKDWILKLNDMDKILLNRIECLEDKSTKSFYETDRILSRIEDLEAKNTQ